MKIKSIVNAMLAQENKQQSNFIDAVGMFDNITAPMFPIPFENISLIVTLEELKEPSMLELRLNSPNDELIGTTNFGVLPDAYGVGKKIINLERFLVEKRGRYTVDIFHVVSEDNPKFIGSQTLFIADYAPKRVFKEGELEKIAQTEGVIKSLKFEFLPPELAGKENAEAIKVHYTIDPNEEIAEGHIAMPKEDFIEIDGHKIDLTGFKNHMEWFFGQPLPEENNEGGEGHDGHKCCGKHDHSADKDHKCSCGCNN